MWINIPTLKTKVSTCHGAREGGGGVAELRRNPLSAPLKFKMLAMPTSYFGVGLQTLPLPPLSAPGHSEHVWPACRIRTLSSSGRPPCGWIPDTGSQPRASKARLRTTGLGRLYKKNKLFFFVLMLSPPTGICVSVITFGITCCYLCVSLPLPLTASHSNGRGMTSSCHKNR